MGEARVTASVAAAAVSAQAISQPERPTGVHRRRGSGRGGARAVALPDLALPTVRQYADICLFSTAQYKCPVAQLEQDDQVSPSSTFCKVYTITPLLSDNREKRGLALDGKLKHEDTNLASSTIVKEGANKEVLGILVSYRVKVKLVVSRGGDVSVELPFVLMHPKPPDHITLPRLQSAVPETDVPVDTNLIEFDTNYATDDDIVFEDFARLRLKGMKDDDYDDQFC